jgi:hypothetical protein
LRSGKFPEKEMKFIKENTYLATPGVSISVAKSSEENLDSNLTGLWWSHLHFLYHQRLVRLPRNRSFTFSFPNPKSYIRLY